MARNTHETAADSDRGVGRARPVGSGEGRGDRRPHAAWPRSSGSCAWSPPCSSLPGALCIALKANPDNALVKFILQTADKLDLGVFSRGKDGVAHFKGHTHEALTKNALVNWGLAAVVWLVVGRVLERIIRP